MIVHKKVEAYANLAKIVFAPDAFGASHRRVQRRHQHCSKNADDGEHGQEFNEGKSPKPPCPNLFLNFFLNHRPNVLSKTEPARLVQLKFTVSPCGNVHRFAQVDQVLNFISNF
jgi:hypothetical protein